MASDGCLSPDVGSDGFCIHTDNPTWGEVRLMRPLVVATSVSLHIFNHLFPFKVKENKRWLTRTA